MPDTIEALGVALFFLTPGLLFELGVERTVGYWRTSLADRVLRFFAYSVIWSTVASLPLWWVWTRWASAWYEQRTFGPLQWLLLVAWVLIPATFGVIIGKANNAGVLRLLVGILLGEKNVPTGWDAAFGTSSQIVRARLPDGRWVAGLYIDDPSVPGGSLASAFPNRPEVFCEHSVDIDPDTGKMGRNADGSLKTRPVGLLLRWESLDVIEVIPVPAPGTLAATEEVAS